jgi:hypothetical protein
MYFNQLDEVTNKTMKRLMDERNFRSKRQRRRSNIISNSITFLILLADERRLKKAHP